MVQSRMCLHQARGWLWLFLLGLASFGLQEAFTGLTGRSRVVDVSRPAAKAKQPAKATPAASTEGGTTKLMEAAHAGDVAKIKELVEKGAELNTQDDYGWTALRYAVRAKNLEAAEALLKLGADVNLASSTGRTPLMSAIGNDFEQMANLLVRSGADLTLKDKGGKTAYDHATRGGPTRSPEIRKMLKLEEAAPAASGDKQAEIIAWLKASKRR